MRVCSKCKSESKYTYCKSCKKEYDKSRNIEQNTKLRSQKKTYYKKNKDSFIKRNKVNNKKAYKSNIRYKIHNRVSNMIGKSLKKEGSILKFLDYSITDLKSSLESKFESWMNWSNWGIYNTTNWNDNDSSTWKWQIDHIIPKSNFKYTSMRDEEFKKCWSLENLRPYSAKLNIIEGIRRIKNE